MCNTIETYQKSDPTHTLTLRSTFAGKFRKRFRDLRGELREGIVDKNVFGLQANFQRREFAGDPVPRQLDQFDEELQALILALILDGRWTDQYVSQAYFRGLSRGIAELKKAGFNIPPLQGGARLLMNTPPYSDNLKVLQDDVYSELQGITASMRQKVMRVLRELRSGDASANQIADEINGIITGSSDRQTGQSTEYKSKLLAFTSVVKVYNRSAWLSYKQFGAEQVGVEVEFVTAGDLRVCPICESLEGSIYPVDEAQTLIPVHPLCRCFLLPLPLN